MNVLVLKSSLDIYIPYILYIEYKAYISQRLVVRITTVRILDAFPGKLFDLFHCICSDYE